VACLTEASADLPSSCKHGYKPSAYLPSLQTLRVLPAPCRRVNHTACAHRQRCQFKRCPSESWSQWAEARPLGPLRRTRPTAAPPPLPVHVACAHTPCAAPSCLGYRTSIGAPRLRPTSWGAPKARGLLGHVPWAVGGVQGYVDVREMSQHVPSSPQMIPACAVVLTNPGVASYALEVRLVEQFAQSGIPSRGAGRVACTARPRRHTGMRCGQGAAPLLIPQQKGPCCRSTRTTSQLWLCWPCQVQRGCCCERRRC